MKYIVSLLILISFSSINSFADQNLATCLGGYCEGDAIFMLTPPKVGNIRVIDLKKNTLTVEYFNPSTGRSQVTEMLVKDSVYNLRKRTGCTPGTTDKKFCVGEQVYISGSSAYGVVAGISPTHDTVVVQRDNDRRPEDYWIGQTKGNVLKMGDRRCIDFSFTPSHLDRNDKAIYEALNVEALPMPTAFPWGGWTKKAGRLSCIYMLNSQTSQEVYKCELKSN